MKLETYPDREFLMLGLANVIAGQLADFLRREAQQDRKSTRLNSSHIEPSRMPSSA